VNGAEFCLHPEHAIMLVPAPGADVNDEDGPAAVTVCTICGRPPCRNEAGLRRFVPRTEAASRVRQLRADLAARPAPTWVAS
jgi:hypothetical protein